MCNAYETKPSISALADEFGARVPEEFVWERPLFPRMISPGIVLNKAGERELRPMQFGLSPVGCPTPSDPRRPLNNARIEAVEKWPWDIPFRNYRCVVPVSQFHEPCYWGDGEGTEVSFSPRSGKTLGVAGIFRVWRAPQGNEWMITMSMLIRPASPVVMTCGHHRQPFIIQERGFDTWMERGKRRIDVSRAILKQYAAEPELQHTTLRSMAAGWAKRKPARLKNRDVQLAAIDETGHLGF